MKRATLCFVLCGDKLLMINRNSKPFMGLWNAVGGKIERGETEKDCAIREIKEESGITVTEAELFSTFTWNVDDEIGYAFLSRLPSDFDISKYPKRHEEGVIDFKPIEWVLNEENLGVIPDLRLFLSDIVKGEKRDYHLVYEGNKLIDMENKR